MNIIEDTQKLINESDLSLTQICNRTGISQRWMQNFIHGKMKDPGALKVEKIRDLLENWNDAC